MPDVFQTGKPDKDNVALKFVKSFRTLNEHFVMKMILGQMRRQEKFSKKT